MTASDVNTSSAPDPQQRRDVVSLDTERAQTKDAMSSTNPKSYKDRGWAWLVVVASFFSLFLVDGTIFSFGVLYVVFLEEFGESKSQTVVVTTITVVAMNCTALFVGPACDKFGFRPVAIVGSVLAAIGYGTSCLATDIWHLYLTIGFTAGLGFAFMHLPSIACVQYYFDKHRSLAMGISATGTGVGTFALAPFIKFVMREIGWRMTVVVIGGIFLVVGVPLGLVFRPLPVVQKEHSQVSEPSNTNTDTRSKENCSMSQEIAPSDVTNSRVDTSTSSERNGSISGEIFPSADEIKSSRSDECNSGPQGGNARCVSNNPSTSAVDKLSGTIFSCPTSTGQYLKHTFDFRLLKNYSFSLYLVSTFLIQLGYLVPYSFLPDKAEEQGIEPKDAAFLISAAGIGNTAIRIVIGFIADFKCINRLALYTICVFISGVCMIMIPFCSFYTLLVIDMVVYGIFSGSIFALYAVVLRDIVGMDNYNQSLGLMLTSLGVGQAFHPLSGLLYDVTGDYDLTFNCAGAAYFLGSIPLMLIPVIKHAKGICRRGTFVLDRPLSRPD